MNFKKTITTLAVTGAFLVSSQASLAAGNNGYGTSNCQVVYGGGEVCPSNIQFSIDKKVLSPTKGGAYVDNLGMNDPKFVATNDVAFRITIRNTGNTAISQMNVTDTLPANISFISGAGSYNASNNTVTYTINNLPAGQTNEQTIVARVATEDKLPKDQGVFCLTNKVSATDNRGTIAEDTAGFCVQQNLAVQPTPTPQVYDKVPVKNIPTTGPELLPLAGLIPAGLAGLILRRKTKIN